MWKSTSNFSRNHTKGLNEREEIPSITEKHIFLFTPFNHYDVIAKLCFHRGVCVHGLVHTADRQGEGCILEGPHHRASAHPAQISLEKKNNGRLLKPYSRAVGQISVCLVLSRTSGPPTRARVAVGTGLLFPMSPHIVLTFLYTYKFTCESLHIRDSNSLI